LSLALRVLAWLVGLGALAGLFGAGGLYAYVHRIEAELPSVTELRGGYDPPQVTRVLARDGTTLAELFTERRTIVPVEEIPSHVKLAVLAAEDASFYEHEGLNYLGIARAFLVNLKSGRLRQGGSTITQQVVKNLLLDHQRTLRRKLKEALLARRLEQELAKDEILGLYLNHIYFGHGRYGVEEAFRYYFGHSVRAATISEAAIVAGLVAGPEIYSPRRDASKSMGRRDFVLGQMREKGFVKESAWSEALAEPLTLAATHESSNELAPEAVEVARRLLTELEPERSRRGGFTIHTTIDPRLQAVARKSVRANLEAYDARHRRRAPFRAPKLDRRGRPLGDAPPLFQGAPRFESHRVLVGEVVRVDDARGELVVRVGTVRGTLKIAEWSRYAPGVAKASEFAEPGARLRVSLLAAPTPPVAASASGNGAGNAESAQGAVVDDTVPLRLEEGPESALIALDLRSRDVLALVGSYEGLPGALDRALQAKRQPGSTFKPVVYGFGLESHRFTPASLVDVTPDVFEGKYAPTNYEGWTGVEPIRLREALANSVNLAAVRVLRDLGPTDVVSFAKSLGVTSTLQPDLSLALGSYEVHPAELADVYAVFASGGVSAPHRLVTRIVGPDGLEVKLPQARETRRAMSAEGAYLTTSMLTSVVDHGTAARAKVLGRPVAGKTGTTNDAKDTWFAGFSTDLVAVVWVGYDDGKPLGSETGGSAALPAWIDFMRGAHAGRPATEFPRPDGVVDVRIDKATGLLARDTDADALLEVFAAGTEPKEYPDAGAPPPVDAETTPVQ
jgi:penicillin-binding protein 1A